MTPAFRHALLWIVASILMYAAAMSSLGGAFTAGHFVPDNEDAFYHARRVLDAVMNHAPVIQFDPKIHAPEGSWLVWPWGFDTMMAKITGLFGPFADVDHANRVLMNIPPVASMLATLLVVLLARRLSLSLVYSAILAIAFALLPSAFRAFSVGNVDHHFAELLVTLAVWNCGAWFFRAGNRSVAAAVTFGAVLGGAVALQNGLFILQVPLCAFLALRWLRGDALPERRQMIIFAATLLLATLAVCIPSEPWRRGFFEFYTLSWFHFYVAATVAVFVVLLSQFPATKRSIVLISLLALAVVVPLIGALHLASEFVTGSLAMISDIGEAKSPYRLFVESGATESTMYASSLIFLMAPMTLLNAWWAWRRRDAVEQFAAVMSIFGLALFQFQYRFGVFGMLPMLLTPVLAARSLAESKASLRWVAPAATAVLIALAYLPTLGAWQTTWALGSNFGYMNITSTWPRFAGLCRERPGIALATIEAGHWIRYHTDCSVMANVFLLTPQHAAKINENSHLLRLTPRELLAERSDIRYVLVYHEVLIREDPPGAETPLLEPLRLRLAPLERELLGPDASIPPQFKKRWEVRSPHGQIYSRLYEIVRD